MLMSKVYLLGCLTDVGVFVSTSLVLVVLSYLLNQTVVLCRGFPNDYSDTTYVEIKALSGSAIHLTTTWRI